MSVMNVGQHQGLARRADFALRHCGFRFPLRLRSAAMSSWIHASAVIRLVAAPPTRRRRPLRSPASLRGTAAGAALELPSRIFPKGLGREVLHAVIVRRMATGLVHAHLWRFMQFDRSEHNSVTSIAGSAPTGHYRHTTSGQVCAIVDLTGAGSTIRGQAKTIGAVRHHRCVASMNPTAPCIY